MCCEKVQGAWDEVGEKNDDVIAQEGHFCEVVPRCGVRLNEGLGHTCSYEHIYENNLQIAGAVCKR